jgi:hypothetical protein
MIGNNARGVTRLDDIGVVIAFAAAKWLRFAAAPIFTIMALLTVVLDNSLPNTFCTAAGSLWPGGMAPMYLLMAASHLVPWLRLISRRGNAARHAQCGTSGTLFPDLDRSSCVQTVEPKR